MTRQLTHYAVRVLISGMLSAGCSQTHERSGQGGTGGVQNQPEPPASGTGASTLGADGGAGGPAPVDGDGRGAVGAADSEVWIGEMHNFQSSCDIDGNAFSANELNMGVPALRASLSLDLDSDGRVLAAGMIFGTGAAPLAPSDDTASDWVQPCITTPFVGFEYVGHEIDDDGQRLTLGINALDVYGTWCGEQEPVAIEEVPSGASGFEYACRPYGEEHADYDPGAHAAGPSPMHVGEVTPSLPEQLCFPWRETICQCSAQNCRLAEQLRYFDLLRSGDSMEGVLVDPFDEITRLLLRRVQ